MPEQKNELVQPLTFARFAIVAQLLGVLCVTVLVPFGLVAGGAGWLQVFAWGADQLAQVGRGSPDTIAIAALVAASLVAGVAIANWVGGGPTVTTAGPTPESPRVTRVLRPWWTMGAVLLSAEVVAGRRSVELLGLFATAVAVFAFALWLGGTATWAAIRVIRWVARVGWHLGTGSMVGTVALAGLAIAAVSLWIGAGMALVAVTPELRAEYAKAVEAERARAARPPSPPAAPDREEPASGLVLASATGARPEPPDCLEQLTPALRRQAQTKARAQNVSWEDAEDLVAQVALAICVKHPERFEPAYFLQAVQFAAMRWWKRELRRCPLPDEPAPSCEPDPEDQLIHAEQYAILQHFRCQLAPEDQQILALAVDEWLIDREIGARLGIEPATARKRLSRAKEHLRRRILQDCAMGE